MARCHKSERLKSPPAIGLASSFSVPVTGFAQRLVQKSQVRSVSSLCANTPHSPIAGIQEIASSVITTFRVGVQRQNILRIAFNLINGKLYIQRNSITAPRGQRFSYCVGTSSPLLWTPLKGKVLSKSTSQ